MNYTILEGDNRTTLKTLADNSIDAIVTDPPYGIDFLGKSWDANTGALETYQECLRVLKPGGHIMAFSAARTYHHLAITLEQAGFEIRDQIMWIYSSGFPKSQDVGRQIQKKLGVKETKKNPTASKSTFNNVLSEAQDKQRDNSSDDCKPGSAEQVVCTDPEAKKWSGWGTQLKPAHEPICMARKPMKTSIAKNCQQWGVGALNIDATRIDWEPGEQEKEQAWREKYTKTNIGGPVFAEQNKNDLPVGGQTIDAPAGRFPANVIGEIPDYQKYFYCPKVSRKERHIGHDNDSVPSHNEMAQAMGGSLIDHDGNPSVSGNKALIPGLGEIYTHGLSKHYDDWCKQNGHVFEKGNNHPTVKPVELMKYLIKLITPPGGTVLDPFNGSGSTGMAAVELGHAYIGCELDPRYVEIAKTRIAAWLDLHGPDPRVSELFE